MDVYIRLTIPNYIYRFYQDAARHVADSSPETVMSDALCAYAGLLNADVAKIQKALQLHQPDETMEENSGMSRSR